MLMDVLQFNNVNAKNKNVPPVDSLCSCLSFYFEMECHVEEGN